ncbi:MAG: carboxy-S-adenosyl-L-methionine synthase CmoA [Thermodesulfobacteriota bacterium]
MSKDNIFTDHSPAPPFTFNDKVAEVFDDMLHRSVPNYEQVIKMSAGLLDQFLAEGDLIYDLGCSTGHNLVALASQLRHRQLRFIGLDNSEAMIAKARLKAEMYGKEGSVTFQLADITSTELQPCGAILLNYTLQFLRPLTRAALLAKIFASLRPGGILIMAEKVISRHPGLNSAFIDLYHDFKRQQGYSELEIARKREALENVLIPFSIQENLELLRDTGFSGCESFCQWFNFVGLVALKEGEEG